MKTKYALLVILFIFFADNLISQSISYILPDICSPNMNTYIEIIAPTDANGNFGIDGLTYSTGNDLKIELLNPADSQKIVFGPLVVSWNGRVISTQVFCNPWVTPNSDYWNNLNTQYRIPFRVNVGGIGSNYDTIYIVRPYHLGDIASNPERVFGEGTLGRRSRRGAMIVDSLIMADNATYRSSYTDCDPQTPASNQAYLPFILLVKGRVSGGSINTKLSVDGGVTRIQNGGPGGGGGGGRFCDYIFGSNNDYGGDGFTGGGRGGVNNIVTHDGTYTNYGSGTGTGGSSLNGVEHGQTPSSWEASGGGTGHPFGISGNGCDNGPDCNPPGGYGGGSGYKNNQAGGSGGNATSATGAGANGGKANGNIMIVPFAGGSGGASGNPNGVNVCSGSGGGGGGAIRLFSVTTSNLTITANGANGGNQGDNDKGGGGSGGAIDLSSKLSANNISLNADGGDTGNDKAGAGRIRNDNGSSRMDQQ
jgi:hypothetical protein